MKKNRRYNIAILPVMIDAFVEAYQGQCPLTITEKDEIVAKTMDLLQKDAKFIKDLTRVKSIHAYILKKMIVTFRVPDWNLVVYFNWGMEWWENYIPEYIRNIISNHRELIDGCLKNEPSALSRGDKALWKVFCNNPYANARQLAAIMGMTDLTVFHGACHRLINSCFSIYQTNRLKT